MASLVTQLAEEEIGRHCFPEDGLDLVVNWNRPVLGPGEEVNSASFFDVTSHCAGEFQSCRKVDPADWRRLDW